ncbi:MAG: hypothetical protein JSR67_02180 [Proteobacteria bacterium]|nr:hypothetical protein [Pseudomonadota bacterium]
MTACACRSSIRAWLPAAAVLLGVACSTMDPAGDLPAVRVNPTAQGAAQLAAAVSQALGGRQVRLADDALTRDSVLLIERQQPRDAAGVPYDSRSTEAPQRFHLVKRGSRCVLVQERTGRRFELTDTTCEVVTRSP